ncbi:hypothetical protein OH492_01915 [Vibrio chagasii]|nr:hypothetical protein [Vibrio chagasii]
MITYQPLLLKSSLQLLALHADDSELDVQVIPATVLWGRRKPGKENKSIQKPYLQAMNGL